MQTDRLLLRQWQAEDRAPFAAMNADPAVMRYFPAPLDRAASNAFADRNEAGIAERGWGLWAVDLRSTGEFAGFVGLQPVPLAGHYPSGHKRALPFAPAVEIGWRLAAAQHGFGYATEAARLVRDHAFGALGLDELVSFTTEANHPSRHVMVKLGMTHDPADDFDHPGVDPSWPGRRHVLYRLGPR
jgi:RimJ/RimL family protein N-acetyltransferase